MKIQVRGYIGKSWLSPDLEQFQGKMGTAIVPPMIFVNLNEENWPEDEKPLRLVTLTIEDNDE